LGEKQMKNLSLAVISALTLTVLAGCSTSALEQKVDAIAVDVDALKVNMEQLQSDVDVAKADVDAVNDRLDVIAQKYTK
jgi:outer membrane murein-binding lipoprotein Lpp